jgi:hypothetical protein
VRWVVERAEGAMNLRTEKIYVEWRSTPKRSLLTGRSERAEPTASSPRFLPREHRRCLSTDSAQEHFDSPMTVVRRRSTLLVFNDVTLYNHEVREDLVKAQLAKLDKLGF